MPSFMVYIPLAVRGSFRHRAKYCITVAAPRKRAIIGPMNPDPATKILLSTRKFTVNRKLLTGSDGRPHDYDYIVHPGAVVILPLLDGNQCVLIRNYRPAIGRELWELPAGTLDVPGEPLEAAAARELEEETGYRAARLEKLCYFYT